MFLMFCLDSFLLRRANVRVRAFMPMNHVFVVLDSLLFLEGAFMLTLWGVEI